MSITNATIDAWLERNRGMRCTPQSVFQVCRGERVVYTDKKTHVKHIVTVVNVGPFVSNKSGSAEPASVTVLFEDGHERNTTLQYIRPL